jgi:hypothetical protein
VWPPLAEQDLDGAGIDIELLGSVGRSVAWPDKITTPWVGTDALRLATPPGNHNIGEYQWVGVQRTKDGWGIHRGDIPNAGTNGFSG